VESVLRAPAAPLSDEDVVRGPQRRDPERSLEVAGALRGLPLDVRCVDRLRQRTSRRRRERVAAQVEAAVPAGDEDDRVRRLAADGAVEPQGPVPPDTGPDGVAGGSLEDEALARRRRVRALEDVEENGRLEPVAPREEAPRADGGLVGQRRG